MARTKIKIVGALVVVLFSLMAEARSPYKAALKKWTEKDSAYSWDNFEARMVWQATYQGAEFRKARVEEQARIYQLREEEKAALMKKEEEELAVYDDFFVALYTGSGQWSDIGKDLKLWRIVLALPDERENSSPSIEVVKSGELERKFYPYIDKWSRTFRIRFAKFLPPETKEFSLRMIGIPATSTLEWKVK
ncbi:MAG: hypothetical protein HYS22_02195 [Deltaproteobacteria bacterium]|nr:hypothetical protein [Deltaproteobacteria bacterium]